MTHAGRRLAVTLGAKKISYIVGTGTWKVIVLGIKQVKIFSQGALQMVILHILIMEFSGKSCLLASFHLRSSSPNTVTVYGGGSRI